MNKKKTIRIGIYKRVSTGLQVIEGSSLQSQERLLKDLVKANSDKGWVLEEGMIFSDEGVSGAKEHRPGLSALKEAVINGDIDSVLVLKIDRLFRETQFLLSFVKFLNNNKVELISKNEEIDTRKPIGTFFLTLMGAFASMERDLIRERTILGKLQKSKEGYFVGGNMPPTGFALNSNKKMIIDKDESKIIKEIFNLALEGKTSNEISKIISAKGIETKFEKNVKDGSKRVKKIKNHWCSKTILTILRNTTYKGKYYYGKTTKEYDPILEKYITIKAPKEDWILIKCPKIIEEDIFDKVQENIEKNKKVGRGQYRIFTGKVYCALCGYKFHGSKGTKNTMNYKCHNAYLSRAGSEKYLCHNSQVSEKILKNYSIDKIRELISDPTKFYESYINNDNEFKKVYISCSNELEGINKQIAKLNRKNSNLIDDLSEFENQTTRNNIRVKIKKNEEDVVILEKRRKEISTKMNVLNNKKDGLKAINAFIKSYNIKLQTLNDDQENELIEMFVKKVIVNFDNIIIEMNIKGNHKDKDKYDELKRKLDELDADNKAKKKLQNSSGGEKGLKVGLKDNHLHLKN